MELKLYGKIDLTDVTIAFNRTIMELKHKIAAQNEAEQEAFNRTIMELKRDTAQRLAAVDIAFNRTIMELKHWWAALYCF